MPAQKVRHMITHLHLAMVGSTQYKPDKFMCLSRLPQINVVNVATPSYNELLNIKNQIPAPTVLCLGLVQPAPHLDRIQVRLHRLEWKSLSLWNESAPKLGLTHSGPMLVSSMTCTHARSNMHRTYVGIRLGSHKSWV